MVGVHCNTCHCTTAGDCHLVLFHRPCPNCCRCAARNLHLVQLALFISALPHLNLFFHIFFNPFSSSSSSTEFRIRRFLDKPRRELVIVRRRLDSGFSREPTPFVTSSSLLCR
ncbi:hypothetical protein HDV63DRAFT_153270 [Trichoderma sp. SZMC 28014]